jgi:hypothetical protein
MDDEIKAMTVNERLYVSDRWTLLIMPLKKEMCEKSEQYSKKLD